MNKIFMVAWAIWNNRNDIVWKQKGKEFTEIVTSTNQILNDWKYAQDRSFDHSLGFITQAEGDRCWTKPKECKVKVNSDAALFEDSNLYSYAVVARDQDGQMLEPFSSCKQGNINPELAEAVGIREALSWVKGNGWSEVEVESDRLIAFQAIRCSSLIA